MAKKEWLAKGADGLSFGERLGDLITKKGITQAELAKETGIVQSALSGYVSGKRLDPDDDTTREYRAPDCATVITLAKYFSVSADYLLGISDKSSPSMEIRAVCDYTGLSESSAEYLHARRASKTGFLTRLIDGILSETVIDEDVPFWVLQSAQAAALASVESDFAEDKCNIENKVAYLSRAEGSQYVISARDASDFYLRRAIEVATSTVSGVVMDMRDDVLADIRQLQCDGAEFFQFIKLVDSEMGETNNGND